MSIEKKAQPFRLHTGDDPDMLFAGVDQLSPSFAKLSFTDASSSHSPQPNRFFVGEENSKNMLKPHANELVMKVVESPKTNNDFAFERGEGSPQSPNHTDGEDIDGDDANEKASRKRKGQLGPSATDGEKDSKQRNRRRRQIEELEPSEVWHCPFGCQKVYKKSSTRSIYKHLSSCTRRSEMADKVGNVSLPKRRKQRKRRKSSELAEHERWHCPFGCGKFYRTTSTRSIRKHKADCPKVPPGGSGIDFELSIPKSVNEGDEEEEEEEEEEDGQKASGALPSALSTNAASPSQPKRSRSSKPHSGADDDTDMAPAPGLSIGIGVVDSAASAHTPINVNHNHLVTSNASLSLLTPSRGGGAAGAHGHSKGGGARRTSTGSVHSDVSRGTNGSSGPSSVNGSGATSPVRERSEDGSFAAPAAGGVGGGSGFGRSASVGHSMHAMANNNHNNTVNIKQQQTNNSSSPGSGSRTLYSTTPSPSPLMFNTGTSTVVWPNNNTSNGLGVGGAVNVNVNVNGVNGLPALSPNHVNGNGNGNGSNNVNVNVNGINANNNLRPDLLGRSVSDYQSQSSNSKLSLPPSTANLKHRKSDTPSMPSSSFSNGTEPLSVFPTKPGDDLKARQRSNSTPELLFGEYLSLAHPSETSLLTQLDEHLQNNHNSPFEIDISDPSLDDSLRHHHELRPLGDNHHNNHLYNHHLLGVGGIGSLGGLHPSLVATGGPLDGRPPSLPLLNDIMTLPNLPPTPTNFSNSPSNANFMAANSGSSSSSSSHRMFPANARKDSHSATSHHHPNHNNTLLGQPHSPVTPLTPRTPLTPVDLSDYMNALGSPLVPDIPPLDGGGGGNASPGFFNTNMPSPPSLTNTGGSAHFNSNNNSGSSGNNNSAGVPPHSLGSSSSRVATAAAIRKQGQISIQQPHPIPFVNTSNLIPPVTPPLPSSTSSSPQPTVPQQQQQQQSTQPSSAQQPQQQQPQPLTSPSRSGGRTLNPSPVALSLQQQQQKRSPDTTTGKLRKTAPSPPITVNTNTNMMEDDEVIKARSFTKLNGIVEEPHAGIPSVKTEPGLFTDSVVPTKQETSSSSPPSASSSGAGTGGGGSGSNSPAPEGGIFEDGIRYQRRRRNSSELKDYERWRCPFGCQKFYKKSSTKSIRKHLLDCSARTDEKVRELQLLIQGMPSNLAVLDKDAAAQSYPAPFNFYGPLSPGSPTDSEDGTVGNFVNIGPTALASVVVPHTVVPVSMNAHPHPHSIPQHHQHQQLAFGNSGNNTSASAGVGVGVPTHTATASFMPMPAMGFPPNSGGYVAYPHAQQPALQPHNAVPQRNGRGKNMNNQSLDVFFV